MDDPELSDLPQDLRWREWMSRVEAFIFAAPHPVPRAMLASLVGRDCRLDELIADIRDELTARPYELVFLAGGWQFCTRSRYASMFRALRPTPRAAALTKTETFIVTAIAYLQPVPRTDLSRLVGKEIGRDVLARLKSRGLIAAGPRVPAPGAPLTYVTTKAFLVLFGLGSLRDLPNLEALEASGILARKHEANQEELDDFFGLSRVEEGESDEPTDEYVAATNIG